MDHPIKFIKQVNAKVEKICTLNRECNLFHCTDEDPNYENDTFKMWLLSKKCLQTIGLVELPCYMLIFRVYNKKTNEADFILMSPYNDKAEIEIIDDSKSFEDICYKRDAYFNANFRD